MTEKTITEIAESTFNKSLVEGLESNLNEQAQSFYQNLKDSVAQSKEYDNDLNSVISPFTIFDDGNSILITIPIISSDLGFCVSVCLCNSDSPIGTGDPLSANIENTSYPLTTAEDFDQCITAFAVEMGKQKASRQIQLNLSETLPQRPLIN